MTPDIRRVCCRLTAEPSWSNRRARGWRAAQGLRDQRAVGFEDGEDVAVELRGPARSVHDVMMVVAQRDDVDQGRGPAVLPVDDVVGLGPAVGSGAAGISTAVVADLSGPVELGWDRPAGPAHVEG